MGSTEIPNAPFRIMGMVRNQNGINRIEIYASTPAAHPAYRRLQPPDITPRGVLLTALQSMCHECPLNQVCGTVLGGKLHSGILLDDEGVIYHCYSVYVPTPPNTDLSGAFCVTHGGYREGRVEFPSNPGQISDDVPPISMYGETSPDLDTQQRNGAGNLVKHLQSVVSGFVDGRAVPGVPLRMQVTLEANHLPEDRTLNGMIPEIVVFYAQQCAFCKLAAAGDPCCGKMQPESITLNYSETGDQKSAIFTFKATPTGEFLESDASCAQNAGDRIVLIDPST